MTHPSDDSDRPSLDLLATQLRRRRPAPELWSQIESKLEAHPPSRSEHPPAARNPIGIALRHVAAATVLGTAAWLLSTSNPESFPSNSRLLTAHELESIERDQRDLDRQLHRLRPNSRRPNNARTGTKEDPSAHWNQHALREAQSDRNLERCRQLAAQNPLSRAIRDSLYRATERRVEQLQTAPRLARDTMGG